ncbi:MAG: DUF3267 domain-containing protein [Lachnospiraceae bacterium]|nr:DUF3267 domain-containing protein [Lachnospiraceae bacterium]
MKLHYKKGFDGDYSKLPSREVEGAVPFKEPESIEKLSLIANIIAIFILIAACVPIAIVSGGFEALRKVYMDNLFLPIIFCVALLAVLPLHELLHAICFKEEVEFYTYLTKGVLFVVGTESFSKARFVFMCLLPNLVFGFIPYILFFVFPSQILLGFFGAICICTGAGDYINVFNALTQMPRGAKCYMNREHSYWYLGD